MLPILTRGNMLLRQLPEQMSEMYNTPYDITIAIGLFVRSHTLVRWTRRFICFQSQKKNPHSPCSVPGTIMSDSCVLRYTEPIPMRRTLVPPTTMDDVGRSTPDPSPQVYTSTSRQLAAVSGRPLNLVALLFHPNNFRHT